MVLTIQALLSNRNRSALTAGKVSEIRYLIFCLINALQVHPAEASYAHALVYAVEY
jgi:hypothetical protein